MIVAADIIGPLTGIESWQAAVDRIRTGNYSRFNRISITARGQKFDGSYFMIFGGIFYHSFPKQLLKSVRCKKKNN